jgi:ABC-2 type transport system ATP-binding protein
MANPIIEIKNLSKTYEYYKKQPGLWASIKGLFKREKLFTKAVDNIILILAKGN